jgi:SAM-dependent methyltransferase
MTDPSWLEYNRRGWDERVDLHLEAESYDLGPLRSGRGELTPIEEAEIGPVDGLHILHLQCHFGRDTLTLAQRGATVVGLDFSPRAITVARTLADELGFSDRARFIEADVYDAPKVLNEVFDLVFINWGALCWLPDIRRWAELVAHFIKPGGALYQIENHPCSEVFENQEGVPGGMPGYSIPYFTREALRFEDPSDYASPNPLQNPVRYEWSHPLGEIVSSLIASGLTLNWLHEHDSTSFQRYSLLVKDSYGMYRWPDKAWFPLSFSLRAERLDTRVGSAEQQSRQRKK